MVNQQVLHNKLETLKGFRNFDPASIDKLGILLMTQDDKELFRINPRYFAQQYGFDEQECINLFIHGAKIGLFDAAYNMLCPVCGGVVHTHRELDELDKNTFHCHLCDINVNVLLDEQVEVSFTLHPDVKALNLNPLQDASSYYQYHFSSNYEQPNIVFEHPESIVEDFRVLDSDGIITIPIEGAPPYTYKFATMEYNTVFWVHFDKEEDTSEHLIETNLLSKGFAPAEIHLSPGQYKLKIRNHTRRDVGVLIHKVPFAELMEFIEANPPVKRPFLTASQLINNQNYRDLFRVQRLSESLNLAVKNLTIMFTDIKGSTAMYDQAGDMFAYQLIREHFQLLDETVREHSGAIVKTMGDAIMATFTSPVNGFLCALDMIQKLDRLNKTWSEQGHNIQLKVGLNNGPALTVINDERLDYFGQSINIAARLQGLAGASEIYISDSVYHEANVESLIPDYNYISEQQDASLKGVGQPVKVYKVFRAAP